MAGDLGQQGPGHALNAKGEAHMFHRALMAQTVEHVEKALRFFRGQALIYRVDVRGGIAELGRAGHGPLRVRGVGQQFYIHRVLLVLWAGRDGLRHSLPLS